MLLRCRPAQCVRCRQAVMPNQDLVVSQAFSPAGLLVTGDLLLRGRHASQVIQRLNERHRLVCTDEFPQDGGMTGTADDQNPITGFGDGS